MKRMRWVLIPVFLVMIILVSSCSGGDAGAGAGNRAPDFELYGLDGEVYSLAQFRGSPVVLNFWATWCPPCRGEMPYLNTVYQMWSDTELVFYTVNIGENSATVQDYLNENGLDLPVLMDSAKTVARKYNVNAIPTTFFIDESGIIQKMKIGSFSSEAELEDYLYDLVP